MSRLLYHIFLLAYSGGIRIAALWNEKARLWIRGRRQFPSLPAGAAAQRVWMHCASLGEFEQGRPLLESIKAQYPDVYIVLSFFSPSGYEVMKNYTGADYIFYLPADSKKNAAQLLDVLQPTMICWVKYEFWFYYLTECRQRNIPLLMVSGLFRQEQPFFKWYGLLWKKMLDCFTHIFVQNEESKELLAEINISLQVSVAGDTRFDRVIAIADKFEALPLVEKFCSSSKVIVAGSTWEEDETELTHYVKANPQLKFIIAPHEIHKENLADVKKEFPQSVFYSALAADAPVKKDTHVLIIDNIGMLSRLYHYADITFVGGGFGSDGVHNVLEPAVYGKPVICGPCHTKFAEAVELVECGAGITISNALELEKVLTELWQDEKLLKQKCNAAREFVYAKAGATKKIMDYIQANRLLTN